MKKLSDLLDKQKFIPNDEPKLCHYMFSLDYNTKYLKYPVLSSELTCPYCQGTEHHAPLMTADRGEIQRIWICAKCPKKIA
jgi:hypothetical protein